MFAVLIGASRAHAQNCDNLNASCPQPGQCNANVCCAPVPITLCYGFGGVGTSTPTFTGVPGGSTSPGAAYSGDVQAPRTVPGAPPNPAGTQVSTELAKTLTPGTVLGRTVTPACTAGCRPSTATESTVARDTGGRRDQSAGDNERTAEQTGLDPVNVANGEFYIEDEDLAMPGRGVSFRLRRAYRSRIALDGPLGFGWDHSYNQRIVIPEKPDCTGALLFATGEGTSIRFAPLAGLPLGVYVAPPGVRQRLTARTTGLPGSRVLGWTMVAGDGTTRTFDERGLLVKITDAAGVGLVLAWEADPTRQWRVDWVLDEEGRRFDFRYGNGRLTEVVEDRSGLKAKYTYRGSELHSATNAAGATQSFKYDPLPSAPELPADIIPEAFLAASCELSCAPSGSQCGAGGGCPDLTSSASINGWCQASFDRCMSQCGDPSNAQSDCNVACTRSCEEKCATDSCGVTCAPSQFQTACTSPQVRSECARTCQERAGEDCRARCRIPDTTGYNQRCLQNCTACILTGNSEIPPSRFNPGSPGCPGASCNLGTSCVDDCVWQVAFGLSRTACRPAKMGPGCVERSATECAQRCATNPTFCADRCKVPNEACLASCRSSLCPSRAHCGGFKADCQVRAQDCRTDCAAGCIARYRNRVPRPIYGQWTDLARNLTEIYVGGHENGGRLLLRNVYGKDQYSPTFDTVIRQENAGHAGAVAMQYHFKGNCSRVEKVGSDPHLG